MTHQPPFSLACSKPSGEFPLRSPGATPPKWVNQAGAPTNRPPCRDRQNQPAGSEFLGLPTATPRAPAGRHEASSRAWCRSRRPCPPIHPAQKGETRGSALAAPAPSPAHRLVGQLLHAVELLLHGGGAAVASPLLPRLPRATPGPPRQRSPQRQTRLPPHCPTGRRRDFRLPARHRPPCLPAPEHRAAPGNTVRAIESHRVERPRPVLLKS